MRDQQPPDDNACVPFCGTRDYSPDEAIRWAIKHHYSDVVAVLRDDKCPGKAFLMGLLDVKLDPSLRPIYLSYASHPLAPVRMAALSGLVAIPGKDIDDALARALADPTAYARYRALLLVEERRLTHLLPAIRQLVSNDPNEDVRRTAIEHLITVEGRDALPFLMQELIVKNDYARIRIIAFLVQLRLKDELPTLRNLYEDKEDEARDEVFKALLALEEPPEAGALVLGALSDEDSRVWRSAMEGAVSHNLKAAIPLIEKILKANTFPGIRWDAEQALAKLGRS